MYIHVAAFRPCEIMQKYLPIILFSYSQCFTYYSFDLYLLFLIMLLKNAINQFYIQKAIHVNVSNCTYRSLLKQTLAGRRKHLLAGRTHRTQPHVDTCQLCSKQHPPSIMTLNVPDYSRIIPQFFWQPIILKIMLA